MTYERGVSLRTVGPIAGAVLLAIVALALHPHMSGHAGPQAELREMGSLSARDRLVHGTLLLLLGMLLTGFASYALRRGLTRRPVVAGLVSFAAGIVGLFAAGLIDGFVLADRRGADHGWPVSHAAHANSGALRARRVVRLDRDAARAWPGVASRCATRRPMPY